MPHYADMDFDTEIKTFVITKRVRPDVESEDFEKDASASKNVGVNITSLLATSIAQLGSLDENLETGTKPHNDKHDTPMESLDDYIKADVKYCTTDPFVQPTSAVCNGEIDENPFISVSLSQLQNEDEVITISNPIVQVHTLDRDLEEIYTKHYNGKYLTLGQSLVDYTEAGVKPFITAPFVRSKSIICKGEIDDMPFISASLSQMESLCGVMETNTKPYNITQLQGFVEYNDADDKPFNTDSFLEHKSAVYNGEIQENRFISEPLSQLRIKDEDIIVSNPIVQVTNLETNITPHNDEHVVPVESSKEYTETDLKPFLTELVQSNNEGRTSKMDIKLLISEPLSYFPTNNLDIATRKPFVHVTNLDGELETNINIKNLTPVHCLQEDIETDVKPYITDPLVESVEEKTYCGPGGHSNQIRDADNKCNEMLWEIQNREYKSLNSIKTRCENVDKVTSDDVELKTHNLIRKALHTSNNISNCKILLHNDNNCIYDRDNNKCTLPQQLYNEQFNCIDFGKGFTRQASLTSYVLSHNTTNNCLSDREFTRRDHARENRYSCGKCGKKCPQRDDLNAHLRTHSGEKKYSSNECERSSHLNNDLLIHSGEQKYSCDECGKKFKQRSNLTAHLFIHSGEKTYNCVQCGKKFNQKSHLKSHLFIHSEERKYSCDECGNKYKHRSSLATHLLVHSGEQKYCCDQCGRKFNIKSQLSRHLMIHSEERKYSCDECGKKFKLKSTFTDHLLTHAEDKKYSCDECGKKFKQKTSLNTHLLVHNGVKKYSCGECGKKFKQKCALAKHLLIHFGEKKHSCDECGKKFLHRCQLNSHLFIHSEEHKFSCDVCGKGFKQRKGVASHLLVHSGEKKYSCDECGKKFAQSSNFDTHLISHSGVKKYSCDQCGKRFLTKPQLKRHLLIHSGFREYSCDECGKKYRRRDSLKTHILIHSGVKKYSYDECGNKFKQRSGLASHLLIHSLEKKYSCDQCGKRVTTKPHLKRHLLIHARDENTVVINVERGLTQNHI